MGPRNMAKVWTMKSHSVSCEFPFGIVSSPSNSRNFLAVFFQFLMNVPLNSFYVQIDKINLKNVMVFNLEQILEWICNWFFTFYFVIVDIFYLLRRDLANLSTQDKLGWSGQSWILSPIVNSGFWKVWISFIGIWISPILIFGRVVSLRISNLLIFGQLTSCKSGFSFDCSS